MNQPCLTPASSTSSCHPGQHLSLCEHADCILQKGKRDEIGVAFAARNSWRFVKGSQVADLTFPSVQGAAPEPRHSHYLWLHPPVILRLHLATPGVPSSIIGHCLVSTPPSPTTSCQTGLLVNKPVCSYPENYLILDPFIPNTIHPSTACSTCLVRKMGMEEGDK